MHYDKAINMNFSQNTPKILKRAYLSDNYFKGKACFNIVRLIVIKKTNIFAFATLA